MKPAALHKTPPTVSEFLHTATRELQATSSTPRLDAEVLVMHVCGLDRSRIITLTMVNDDQQYRLKNDRGR
jgi:hypothetical protein